jgi:hypothetical protein
MKGHNNSFPTMQYLLRSDVIWRRYGVKSSFIKYKMHLLTPESIHPLMIWGRSARYNSPYGRPALFCLSVFILLEHFCGPKHPLFLQLTKLLTVIKESFRRYCSTAYSRSGVNQMWILQSSKELLWNLKFHVVFFLNWQNQNVWFLHTLCYHSSQQIKV